MTAFCVPSGNKSNTVNPLEHKDIRVLTIVGATETVTVLLSLLSIGYAIRFTLRSVLMLVPVSLLTFARLYPFFNNRICSAYCSFIC